MKINRKPNLLLNILLFVLSVAITSVLCEIIIRVLLPQSLISDLMESCPDYGLCMKKNTVGVQKSSEFNVKIRLNNLGFRGNEISLKPDPTKRRILIVGDSFVFGYGVNEEETFVARLEKLINSNLKKHYEVLNLGQLGFGTAHELKKIQEIGLLLEPYLVILNVYLGNDLYENKRLFELIDNNLIEIPQKTSEYTKARKISRWIPFSSWLRENSHLFRFMGNLYLKFLDFTQAKRDKIITPEDVNLYEHILLKIKSILDKRNIRLIVTLIPYHVELDEYLTIEKPYKELREELKYYRERVKEVTIKMNILVLDFFEYFSSTKDIQNRRRYFYSDPHWTPYGHFLAANALYDFLLKNGFLD